MVFLRKKNSKLCTSLFKVYVIHLRMLLFQRKYLFDLSTFWKNIDVSIGSIFKWLEVLLLTFRGKTIIDKHFFLIFKIFKLFKIFEKFDQMKKNPDNFLWNFLLLIKHNRYFSHKFLKFVLSNLMVCLKSRHMPHIKNVNLVIKCTHIKIWSCASKPVVIYL